MRKIIAVLLTLAIALVPLTVSAEQSVTVSMEYPTPDYDKPFTDILEVAAIGEVMEINARSAILIEPKSGAVLYESNADEKLAPASITKIMSLVLIMEAIADGRLSLDTVVTASEHACSMGGSQIWLEPNEQMTVDELLKAVVIASANDATVALGEAIAGSEEGFVVMMNQKAAELGMNETNFVNCTGLDAEGHLTSAHDVALMSAELVKHELIKNYSTVWMDTLRNGASELVNTNRLVRFYSGAFGLKTGTTSKAGSCLSAAAERDGLTLIAVVMGAPSSNDRFNGARKLLDYGFANFSFENIAADISSLEHVPVKKGTVRQMRPEASGSLPVLLKKGGIANVTQEIEISDTLTAPISKGDIIGYVHIKYEDEEIGTIPITAGETSEKLTVWYWFWALYRKLFSL